MKQMKREYIQKAWLFVYGAAMITLGIIILVQGEFLITPAAIIGGAIITVNGVHQIISTLKANPRLLNGIGNILIGTVTMIAPSMTLGILTMIFSLYVLLNATVKLIDFIASVRNKTNDVFVNFISFAFFLTFGVIMLFGSFYDQRGLLVIAGIYCIMYGATEIKDFIREVLPNRAKTAIRRKVRVSLPLFVSTFVPLGVLKNYQKRLDSREIDIEKLLSEEKIADKNSEPNIHVLIHVSDDGVGMMGHCDLYFDGEVLSYGNYDASSERMFGALGDGVMFTVDFETYVKYGIKYDNQMIFDYGLLLSDEQIEKVRSEIARLKSLAYRWEPPFQLAREKDSKAKLSDFKDYCSRLWDGTKAEFYKFKSGKFKSYCVMSTNCVLLADSVLSKAGTDIVNIAGIISPGSYYDYLQKEYRLENGIVVSRDIYSKYQLQLGDSPKNSVENDKLMKNHTIS